MKLDEHVTVKDKIEIVGQAEKKYQVNKLATINPHKGHILYEFNLIKKEITVAEFDKQDVEMLKLKKEWTGVTKKVIVKPDCIYISALNKKNAIKKFMQQSNEYDKMIANGNAST